MSTKTVMNDPSHPDALRTPNGVVDLRTGEWLPLDEPRRALSTYADPSDDPHGCEHWLSVLDEVTGGNAHSNELIGRFMGYSLGGHTAERAILLLLGSGERRSNLLGAWAYVMGDYAETLLTTIHIIRYGSLFGSSARATKRMLNTVGNMPVMLGEGSNNFVRCATTHEPLEIKHEPQFKLVLTADAFSALDIFPGLDDDLARRVHTVHTRDTVPSVDRDLARALMAEHCDVCGEDVPVLVTCLTQHDGELLDILCVDCHDDRMSDERCDCD